MTRAETGSHPTSEAQEGATAPVGRSSVVVLTGRAARNSTPAATRWQLSEYDPATGLPLGDIAGQWEPIGAPTPAGRTVSRWVLGWAADALGYRVTVGGPADPVAGPGSWYLTADPDPDPTVLGSGETR